VLKCTKCGGVEIMAIDKIETAICWRCCPWHVYQRDGNWWTCINCGSPASAMYVAGLAAD
jgi:hypothetical protein